MKLLGEYITLENERLATLEQFQQYVVDGKKYTDPESYISYPTNQVSHFLHFGKF